MKKKSIIIIITVMALLFSFKAKNDTAWLSDKADAKLGFTITHLMFSDVKGWFKTFDGKVISSGEDFSGAKVEMTAEVNSVNTDNKQRDKHLKSPDYFDAVKYPEITFKSTAFKKENDKDYKVTGDLTMHGITKTVVLDAICKIGTNPSNKQKIAGFKITGKLKRSDFGIGTSVSTNLIGDVVSIVADAEFIKK